MRRFRYLLAAILVLLLVAAGVLLSAPWWVDSAAVRSEITRLVARASGDKVTFEQLSLHYFPSIGVEISRLRFASAPAIEAQAESAEVELDAWALLRGRTLPRFVGLKGVRASVRLAPAQAGGPPASRPEIEARMRDALDAITGFAPGLQAAVDDAIVTLQPADGEPLELRLPRVRASISADGISGELASSSPFWTRLAASFSLDRRLVGEGRVTFSGLRAERLAALAGADAHALAWSVAEADASGRAELRMRGLASLEADAFVWLPRVVVYHDGNALAVEGVSAALGMQASGEAYRLNVDRLYVQAPHMLLAGSFARDASGHFDAGIRAWGVDVVAVQAAARQLAPGVQWLSRPPVTVLAGTLSALDAHASAATIPELLAWPALRVEAAIDGAKVKLSRPALELSGVGGRVQLDQGVLRVRNATAVLGQSGASHTSLDLDLTARPMRLAAEGFVAVDLDETLALARRLIADPSTHQQLEDVEAIQGKALAHVTLSGDTGSIESSVDLSNLAVFLQHRYLPLPLRLTAGQLTYAKGEVGLNGVAGYLGRSEFSGLDASVKLASPHAFEVGMSGATLSLEEAYSRAMLVPALKSALAEIGNVTGSLSVTGVRASGSLERPAAVRFRLLAAPRGIKLLPRRLASDVVLDGGSVELTQDAVDARGVGVSTQDSSLKLSARVDGYRDGLGAIEATLDGEAGNDTVERLYELASVPRVARLRAPLRFGALRVALDRQRTLSVQGRVDVAGSVAVALEAEAKQGTVAVKSATVRDAASNAQVALRYGDRRIEAAFRGKFAGTTLATAMQEPPLALGKIEGDFAADVHLDESMAFSANGRLQGDTLSLPAGSDAPVTVESFALTADGASLHVDKATLVRGDNRVDVDGSVSRGDGKWILDANARADRLVVARQDKPAPSTAAPAETPVPPERHTLDLSDLPITGRIGVDIRSLTADGVKLAPLVAEARLAGRHLDLDVTEAALCGIGLAGSLRGEPEALQLDGTLHASGSDLKDSIACLTNSRVVGSGTLTLDARFSAHGELDRLLETLDASFDAASRDGRIEKFDTLNKVFAYLNVTEVVRGKKLDTAGGGLPYRTVTAKGTVRGRVVRFDEMVLDAPTVRIAATGHVDYGSSELRVDALVAPLQTANAVLDRIPIVSRIFGGSVLALPVQVAGSVESPLIVPLGPGAVAHRMTSIIANTLKLPFDAIKMVAPSEHPAAPQPGAQPK